MGLKHAEVERVQVLTIGPLVTWCLGIGIGIGIGIATSSSYFSFLKKNLIKSPPPAFSVTPHWQNYTSLLGYKVTLRAISLTLCTQDIKTLMCVQLEIKLRVFCQKLFVTNVQ